MCIKTFAQAQVFVQCHNGNTRVNIWLIFLYLNCFWNFEVWHTRKKKKWENQEVGKHFFHTAEKLLLPGCSVKALDMRTSLFFWRRGQVDCKLQLITHSLSRNKPAFIFIWLPVWESDWYFFCGWKFSVLQWPLQTLRDEEGKRKKTTFSYTHFFL